MPIPTTNVEKPRFNRKIEVFTYTSCNVRMVRDPITPIMASRTASFSAIGSRHELHWFLHCFAAVSTNWARARSARLFAEIKSLLGILDVTPNVTRLYKVDDLKTRDEWKPQHHEIRLELIWRAFCGLSYTRARLEQERSSIVSDEDAVAQLHTIASEVSPGKGVLSEESPRREFRALGLALCLMNQWDVDVSVDGAFALWSTTAVKSTLDTCAECQSRIAQRRVFEESGAWRIGVEIRDAGVFNGGTDFLDHIDVCRSPACQRKAEGKLAPSPTTHQRLSPLGCSRSSVETEEHMPAVRALVQACFDALGGLAAESGGDARYLQAVRAALPPSFDAAERERLGFDSKRAFGRELSQRIDEALFLVLKTRGV